MSSIRHFEYYRSTNFFFIFSGFSDDYPRIGCTHPQIIPFLGGQTWAVADSQPALDQMVMDLEPLDSESMRDLDLGRTGKRLRIENSAALNAAPLLGLYAVFSREASVSKLGVKTLSHAKLMNLSSPRRALKSMALMRVQTRVRSSSARGQSRRAESFTGLLTPISCS
jgi:hypothetical protein